MIVNKLHDICVFALACLELLASVGTSARSADVRHQHYFKRLTVAHSEVQPVLQPWLARPSRGLRAGLAFGLCWPEVRAVWGH